MRMNAGGDPTRWTDEDRFPETTLLVPAACATVSLLASPLNCNVPPFFCSGPRPILAHVHVEVNEMKSAAYRCVAGLVVLCGILVSGLSSADGLSHYFFQDGPLRATLKSDAPLPLYDADPAHLWNRMFAAFYIRPRVLPATTEQPETIRYEGGDVIEFLAWGKTEYWSSPEVFEKVNPLLDEFLTSDGVHLISDPLKRAVLQHDLWAVFDHLIDLNNRRQGDRETRTRRSVLCSKLARCMDQLALSPSEIERLPNTYEAAVASGKFSAAHHLDAKVDYLPHTLLTDRQEWVEIDFYVPETHEDILDRFISLHARNFMGRSHYRIFYRFPEGRKQVTDYLSELGAKGVDWKKSAQEGFGQFLKEKPEIPVLTEVLLMQLMMTMDDQQRPTPTHIVESVQIRIFCNLNGASIPPTNTGVGVNILDHRMQRHLLFDGLKAGGLHREPEDLPQYRVAIDGTKQTAPDWGFADKTVLFQQCTDCHMSPRLDRPGVVSIPSIIHSGGFDAGAQIGVSRPVESAQENVRSQRVARYKLRHESFRRLQEFLED